MKYEALSNEKRLIYTKQFETMGLGELWTVMDDCYHRIGAHYVLSDAPNEDYMNEQRDIARLARECI